MVDMQCDLRSEEEAWSDANKVKHENDVLRLRMEIMTKENEAEKDKIIKATDKTIDKLKTNNEELHIQIGDQSDKMHQMDKESAGKDKEIESLTKQAKELSLQKDKLEIDLKHARERYEQQDERIKKLESELSEVKKKLEEIIIAKEERESWLATYLKEADEKQERRDKEADEKQERRDKLQEQRDKLIFDRIKQQHTEVLCEIKSMSLIPKSPTRKEPKLNMVDVHSVQIHFDSQNGRNTATFPKNTSFN
jgi:chromosome segregation ATPase